MQAFRVTGLFIENNRKKPCTTISEGDLSIAPGVLYVNTKFFLKIYESQVTHKFYSKKRYHGPSALTLSSLSIYYHLILLYFTVDPVAKCIFRLQF
jgi:hypothetical protein